jgi:hypothetical protein
LFIINTFLEMYKNVGCQSKYVWSETREENILVLVNSAICVKIFLNKALVSYPMQYFSKIVIPMCYVVQNNSYLIYFV